MAFCSRCGTEMNGVSVCPKCGASSGAGVQQNVPVGADVRQRSLADMDHMVRYFSVKELQYKELDAATAKASALNAYTGAGWIVGGVISLLLGLFNLGWFWFVLAAGCVALFVVFKKNNKKKLAEETAHVKRLSDELEQYYSDYGYCAVGYEYSDPEILRAIQDMIRKGRASTPADAINLMLDDQHKAEMEATAKETAEAAKNAAKQAKKAAGYSSASFWFK